MDSAKPSRTVLLGSVLLVGATVRWAAQSASQAGYSVVGMDLFGDMDSRAVCRHFEPISPATAADSRLLQAAIDDLASRTDSRVEIVGGLASIATERTHAELATACEGLPLEVPRTLEFASANSNRRHPRLTANTDASRWLIKARRSSGGLGVQHWDPTSEAQSRMLQTNEYYLQERVRGRSFGVVAIANGRDVRLLGVSRSLHQRIGDLPYVYAGSVGPWKDESLPTSDLLKLATRIADNHKIRGLYNFDLIRDQDHRWWLLEVNERPSGSCEVIERAAMKSGELDDHRSLIGMHLDALAGKELVWRDGAPTSLHVKRIVYAKHDGRFRSRRAPACIADIPEEGTRIARGEPIATLLLDSPFPPDSPNFAAHSTSHAEVAPPMRIAIDQLQASILTREETDHFESLK